ADENWLAAGIKRRANKIGAERFAIFIGNFEHLALGIEFGEEFMAAGFHVGEGSQPARIVRQNPEFGLPVVLARSQPAVHCRLNVAFCPFFVATLKILICDALPFAIPTLLVARNHTAGGEKTFRNGAAAFLRLTERAAKLIAHPRILRPMMPAERFEMSIRTIGNFIDQQFFGHSTLRT